MKYIDVSEHQGIIDWKKVKGNVDGVIIRAGYGRGHVDKYFHENADACNRIGIPCGAYWFSYAYTPEAAMLEAQQLLLAARQHEMELPLAYDWEDDSVKNAQKNGVTPTSALARDMANAFCQTIEGAGYWCMLYTNPSFIAQYFGELAGGRYDLWLAQWPKVVNVANPPRKCGIWQWGGSIVPGISGNVDSNEAYRDYPAFLREKGFNNLKKKLDAPWYAEAMAWARENGLTDKDPADPVTVADVVQMFYNLEHPE